MEPISDLFKHFLSHQLAVRLLPLHVELLLRTVLLKLARLLDHLLSYLLEGPLILVNDLQYIQPRIVLIARITQVVLGVERIAAFRLK